MMILVFDTTSGLHYYWSLSLCYVTLELGGFWAFELGGLKYVQLSHRPTRNPRQVYIGANASHACSKAATDEAVAAIDNYKLRL
jgi:hypothetical protein